MICKNCHINNNQQKSRFRRCKRYKVHIIQMDLASQRGAAIPAKVWLRDETRMTNSGWTVFLEWSSQISLNLIITSSWKRLNNRTIEMFTKRKDFCDNLWKTEKWMPPSFPHNLVFRQLLFSSPFAYFTRWFFVTKVYITVLTSLVPWIRDNWRESCCDLPPFSGNFFCSPLRYYTWAQLIPKPN